MATAQEVLKARAELAELMQSTKQLIREGHELQKDFQHIVKKNKQTIEEHIDIVIDSRIKDIEAEVRAEFNVRLDTVINEIRDELRKKLSL